MRGRPALFPQGKELYNLIDKHPDMTYTEIWRHYGYGGNPKSFQAAINRAGYRRQKPNMRTGGGRMDVGVMSDEDFWGQVHRQTAKDLAEMAAARPYYPQPRTTNGWHAVRTTHRTVANYAA